MRGGINMTLPHVAAALFNTPLLVARGRLDTILAAIGQRVLAGAEVGTVELGRSAAASAERRRVHEYESGGYLAEGGIAVLPVVGTLVRRGSWLDACTGVTAYSSVASSVVEMATDPAVRGIMLEVDSYGGEAAGVFDLADLIRRAGAETGKPVWAHANENACSAGYAVACGAERIWVSRTGEIGSIGVVAAHIDVSAADRMDGVKWTYVFAGDKKVDGNPHQPLQDVAKADIQDDVNDLYAMFTAQVAAARKMKVSAVEATEAAIYRGEKAVTAGLADEIGTFEQALSAFADRLQTGQRAWSGASAEARRAIMSGGKKASAEAVEVVEDKATDPAPVVDDKAGDVKADEPSAAAKAEPVAASGPDADAIRKAEAKRAEGLAAVAKRAEKIGVEFDLVKAIRDGVQPDAAAAAVLETAANADRARVTTTAAANAGSANAGSWGRVLEKRFGAKR